MFLIFGLFSEGAGVKVCEGVRMRVRAKVRVRVGHATLNPRHPKP